MVAMQHIMSKNRNNTFSDICISVHIDIYEAQ